MLRTILTKGTLRTCALGIVAALLLSACGNDEDAPGSAAGPTVVATTTQVADLAANVAGERADVVGILAANADPHDYEPKPSDVEALADAGLVIQSGGDLDLWLDELVESSGSDAPRLALIDSVATIGGDDEDEEADPHWWQDPTNAIAATEAILAALIEADPDGSAEYEGSAEDYVDRLDRLDRQIASCIERVPVADRKLVTSHDALGYFADRYGVEIVGSTIPALSTQAQPSAGETAELVDLIEQQGVHAVFPEVGVSTALEQAIADETGASVGAELYADALGPEGSVGETYVGAMAANASALVDGFSGGAVSCEIDA